MKTLEKECQHVTLYIMPQFLRHTVGYNHPSHLISEQDNKKIKLTLNHLKVESKGKF